MNIDPKVYDQTNSVQRAIANKLIEMIKKDQSKSPIDIALDIGCGSGNITRLLKDNLYIEELYGLDVDQSMIDFAKEVKTSDGLQYICQDFGQNFDEWQALRSIEGKVSLVFSNYSLHWIKDVDTVVQNIARLSAPGGKVYMSIMLDTYKGWPVFNSKFFNKLLKTESKEQLVEIWPAKFKGAGFTIDRCERLISDKVIDENQFQKHHLSLVTGFVKLNFPSYLNWFWSSKISKFIIWLFLRQIFEPFYDENTEKYKRKIKETLILLKMTKVFERC